jgi:hypothetical protein
MGDGSVTTLVNNLIRLARQHPGELTIKPGDVSALAAHARISSFFPMPDDLEVQIRAGKLRFMDIPVRVLGQGRAA